MKKNILYSIISLCALTITLSACHKDKKVTPGDPNTGQVFSVAGDQVGRPGIATVFVSAADKDNFNVTVPSVMGAAYQAKFQTQLQAYNGGAYTTNLLGLSASAFTGVLATDVLGVSTTGKTTYYDGTNVLTGRTLTDDVIDVSLILIFGGPDASKNPGLTSDHVNGNDKPFSTSFPYEAAPW
ncbi:DUF4331 family protein [Mucilaginibacter sp. OK098]|uniref:DUF4331 family protein n=1 Tax=Mucilaginibacter sp. OK098 TaxID=1855297 RepID=UPI00090F7BFC|nr:DUF4331 family protein [Mucilaginibacter sp. OK098]SHM01679.1 protein of unknown function [Mucilaginibacter sp. OK098]